jgi:hypothetical protein
MRIDGETFPDLKGVPVWTPSQRARQAAVVAGQCVVANLRQNGGDLPLTVWAGRLGLLTYIGGATRWSEFRTDSIWCNTRWIPSMCAERL